MPSSVPTDTSSRYSMLSTNSTGTYSTNPAAYTSQVTIFVTSISMCLTDYIRIKNQTEVTSPSPRSQPPPDIINVSSSVPIFLISHMLSPSPLLEPLTIHLIPETPPYLRDLNRAKKKPSGVWPLPQHRYSTTSAPKEVPATRLKIKFHPGISSFSALAPIFQTRSTLVLKQKQKYSTPVIPYITIKEHPLFCITPIVHTPTLYILHTYFRSRSPTPTLQHIKLLENLPGVSSSKCDAAYYI